MKISKRAQVCLHCGAVLKAPAVPCELRSVPVPQGDSKAEHEIMVCHPSSMNDLGLIILGILTAPLVIGLFILLYVWIEIHYTSYTITSMRIIVRRGWIGKLQNEIWIKDMRGVNLVQSVWQRIIGVGTIAIGTAATAGAEINMTGIARPQQVVDRINALRHQ